jgi:GT2 family glycosyltransferase
MTADRCVPTVSSSSNTSQSTNSATLLIVIVNYKTADLTLTCLETLEPELREIPGARVVVVDNASGDGGYLTSSVATRGWQGWVSVDIADRNGGFAYGNNRAIRPTLSSSEPPRYVLLLNSDTEVRPHAVRTLLDFMESHPTVGIAGSGFENPDGSLWPIAFRFITPISEIDRGLQLGLVTQLLKQSVTAREMSQDHPQRVDWVAGACMMVRHQVFVDVGLMDESYFLYFEETDFCLQANRKGWPCWYVPQSRIMHIAGQSSDLTRRDRLPPRTPAYWFESRRHYFTKNYGWWGAVTADLLFGVCFAAWRVRRAIFRKPDVDPPHHLADFWKHSIFSESQSFSKRSPSG